MLWLLRRIVRPGLGIIRLSRLHLICLIFLKGKMSFVEPNEFIFELGEFSFSVAQGHFVRPLIRSSAQSFRSAAASLIWPNIPSNFLEIWGNRSETLWFSLGSHSLEHWCFLCEGWGNILNSVFLIHYLPMMTIGRFSLEHPVEGWQKQCPMKTAIRTDPTMIATKVSGSSFKLVMFSISVEVKYVFGNINSRA